MRLALLASIGLAACSGGEIPLDPTDPVPDTEFAYDLDRLIEVDITLDDADWDALRHQERNIFDLITGQDCLAEPFESPYTWFSATVEIDGVVLDEVAVRKKGLIGSVTPGRPSLKLDFDNLVDGREWEGVERLTLNNGHQDPSRIKQCMGYSLYADAGLPASRCSFARVTVNGEDLGVYSNVEPVKKAMLERHFDSADGNLYEGTLSDFREGWLGSFEDKTERSDRSDLQAVADVLTLPDELLEAELEEVVDVDQYLRFWSMEVVLGHWDGYAGNRNNFYVYADPSDGRFRFIPWGIDGILEGDTPFGEGQPVAVVARSMLPYRAFRHPSLQARYVDTLRSTLDRVWREDELFDRLQHMQQLTEPYVYPHGGDDGRYTDTLINMRSYLATRQGSIERELERGWVEPPAGIDPGTPCLVERGQVEVSFDTTWGSTQIAAPWSYGDGSFSLSYDGNPLDVTFLGSVVGEADGQRILMVSGQFADGRGVLVWSRARNDEVFARTGDFGADWTDVEVYLMIAQGGGHLDYQVAAYLGGDMTLEASTLEVGGRVAGSMDLAVWGGQR